MSELNLINLTIDSEFESMIPPLTEDEQKHWKIRFLMTDLLFYTQPSCLAFLQDFRVAFLHFSNTA